jgi:hypothetical protein
MHFLSRIFHIISSLTSSYTEYLVPLYFVTVQLVLTLLHSVSFTVSKFLISVIQFIFQPSPSTKPTLITVLIKPYNSLPLHIPLSKLWYLELNLYYNPLPLHNPLRYLIQSKIQPSPSTQPNLISVNQFTYQSSTYNQPNLESVTQFIFQPSASTQPTLKYVTQFTFQPYPSTQPNLSVTQFTFQHSPSTQNILYL